MYEAKAHVAEVAFVAHSHVYSFHGSPATALLEHANDHLQRHMWNRMDMHRSHTAWAVQGISIMLTAEALGSPASYISVRAC